MSRPAVSVLLPVRDGAAHLSDCIDSLRRQTLEDVQFVAVDDGSTDGTLSLLRQWAGQDSRVVVVAGPARGLVRALESGRASATADLLARMDADDVAHPERLERQWRLMQDEPELCLCGCLVEYMPEEAVRDGARRYQRWLNELVDHEAIERDIFVECPIAHPTFVMRAHAIERVGGYRERGWPEDYDLVLRLWQSGGRFGKVPRTLLRWREGEDRLSRSSPHYAPEAFRRCKVEALKASLLRGRALSVWGAGPTGKAFARTATSAGIELRSFVDLDPRKIGQRIHGAPVISPSEVESLRGSFVVAAVAGDRGRDEIRTALDSAGWEEGTEYCAVA